MPYTRVLNNWHISILSMNRKIASCHSRKSSTYWIVLSIKSCKCKRACAVYGFPFYFILFEQLCLRMWRLSRITLRVVVQCTLYTRTFSVIISFLFSNYFFLFFFCLKWCDIFQFFSQRIPIKPFLFVNHEHEITESLMLFNFSLDDVHIPQILTRKCRSN